LDIFYNCSKFAALRSLVGTYNGDFRPSYKNQPKKIREKAAEIANALLLDGAEEGVVLATGLKRAKKFFQRNERPGMAFTESDDPSMTKRIPHNFERDSLCDKDKALL
jgi:uncharacterized protein YdaT